MARVLKKMPKVKGMLVTTFKIALLLLAISPVLVIQIIVLPNGLEMLIAQAEDFIPPDDGNPGDRVASGRRGGCDISGSQEDEDVNLTIPLIALVPLAPTTIAKIPPEQDSTLEWEMTSTEPKNTKVGITLDKQPLLWVYIPPIYRGKTAMFMIRDTDNNYLLDNAIEINLSAAPGIVSITLPDRILTAGSKYMWSVEIVCNSRNPSNNPTVSGWIEYSDNPELREKIERATSEQEKLELYSSNDIWYDRLTFLAQKQRENSSINSFESEWIELLKYAHLSELQDESVVDCCSVEEK